MKKTSLYVIQFEDGIKIGITTDLKGRIANAYERPWCKKIKFGVYFPNLSNPKYVEHKVKQELRALTHDRSPEYFSGISFRSVLKLALRISKANEDWVKIYKANKMGIKRFKMYRL